MRQVNQQYTGRLKEQAEKFQTKMNEKNFKEHFEKLTKLKLPNFLKNCQTRWKCYFSFLEFSIPILAECLICS